MFRLICSFISLFFIASFLVFSGEVKAVDKTQRWFCPRSIWCNQPNAGCVTQESSVHRAKITTNAADESWKKPLPNSTSYILECVDTLEGQRCTTGNINTDQEIFSQNNLGTLQNNIGYRFEGLYKADGITISTNPVETKKGLLDPLEWQSFTPQEISRKFMGLNLIEVDSFVPCEPGTNQKECTFTMKEASGTCASIRWDPYGRVFDSQSLEPISGVTVTLFKKNNSGLYEEYNDSLGVVKNPIVTKDTGDFSFVVPDGDYRLASVYNANFKFPFNGSRISLNYNKAYSDLYYATESADFHIRDIFQRGKIVHVDIPLDPLKTPYTTSVKLIGYSTQVNKRSRRNDLIIEGRVSHPLTKIRAYTKETGQFLASTQAGKFGEFEFTINQTIPPPDTCCRIDLEKVNLNSPSVRENQSTIKKLLSFFNYFTVSAQDQQITSFKIESIPNFIQGYAYNNSGKIIPNADVAVYLNFSNNPYFQTKADSSGFFKISSIDLPSMSYYLKYKGSAGAVVKKTTTQFVKENSPYLSDKKVNLYSATSSSFLEPEVSPTVYNPVGVVVSPTSAKQIGSVIQPTSSPSQSNSLIYLIGAILLALFAVVGGLLAFYIVKKKNENPLNNH